MTEQHNDDDDDDDPSPDELAEGIYAILTLPVLLGLLYLVLHIPNC